jgi:hypothetical protein
LRRRIKGSILLNDQICGKGVHPGNIEDLNSIGFGKWWNITIVKAGLDTEDMDSISLHTVSFW